MLNSNKIKISKLEGVTGNSAINVATVPNNTPLLIEVQVDNNTYYGLSFLIWNIGNGARIYNAYGIYTTNQFCATIQMQNNKVKLLGASLNGTGVIASTYIEVRYFIWN